MILHDFGSNAASLKETKDDSKKQASTDQDALEAMFTYIGEMGRYQKFLFAAMLPFGFMFVYVYFVQMFVAATPQHYWCHVPELAHLDLELRYQQEFLLAAKLPFGFMFAYVYFVHTVVAATPQSYWCHVPELAHSDLELRYQQKFLLATKLPFGFMFARNLSAPGAIDGGGWEQCSTFQTNWTVVLETLRPPDNGTPTVVCQHGYDFELTDIPYHTVVSEVRPRPMFNVPKLLDVVLETLRPPDNGTPTVVCQHGDAFGLINIPYHTVFSERGWVCDKSGYAPTAQSIYFAGSFIGTLFFGWLADRFGRIPAIVGSTLIGLVGGVATVYTTGIIDFIIARFLVGLSYDSCFFMIYILVLEYIGPRYRTLAANVSIALFMGSGALSLPWLALWLANWRTLIWVTSAPMLVVVAIPFTVPESVRWLVSRGRTNDAIRVFKKFEKVNRVQIPQDVMEDFVISSRQSQPALSIHALFTTATLRTMLTCMVLVYMCCSVIFDGLVRLSDSLGLDFFITFTLASATEIPSVILLALVLDRWGRRNLTVVPMAITGLLIAVAVFLPKGVALTTVAVTARFFINMAFTAAVQWSTEMLPTGLRASGSSLVHVSGFIATSMSPFIVYSERYWGPLPLVIISALAALAIGCALLLPETMGRPMPQTIADSEALVRNYTLCRNKDEIDDNEKDEPYTKNLMTET